MMREDGAITKSESGTAGFSHPGIGWKRDNPSQLRMLSMNVTQAVRSHPSSILLSLLYPWNSSPCSKAPEETVICEGIDPVCHREKQLHVQDINRILHGDYTVVWKTNVDGK